MRHTGAGARPGVAFPVWVLLCELASVGCLVRGRALSGRKTASSLLGGVG